jgi:4-amino-4-deoxy-L-arabinose transferase-like glycosyltransferase
MKWLRFTSKSLRFSLWFVWVLECFATFVFILRYLIPTIPNWAAVILAALLFAGAIIATRAVRLKDNISPYLKRSYWKYSLAILCLGTLLRLLWVVVVPPIQLSDFADYLGTSRHLLETGIYSTTVSDHLFRAFRPPGYSVFLAGWLEVLGDHSWTPAVANLLLYALSALVLERVALRTAGQKAALGTAFLFAIWPSGIAMTGLAASEPLTLLLFTAACWLFVLSEVYGFRASGIAGILAGFGALTRPTCLVIPALWFVYVLLYDDRLKRRFSHVATATLCMIIVVSPWTIRNYRVLGSFVPISTNGGDVFYRANNPYAVGGYTPRGEQDLSYLAGDEVGWNHTAFALGVKWIKANPFSFLKLVVKKQDIFLGEDNTGAYWSLARPYPQRIAAYEILHTISDLWWFAIWLLTAFVLVAWRDFFTRDPRGGFFALTILFFLAIHSVFESQDRYHMAEVGFMVVVASLAIARPHPSCATSDPETSAYRLSC